jgi:hypothetical protein
MYVSDVSLWPSPGQGRDRERLCRYVDMPREKERGAQRGNRHTERNVPISPLLLLPPSAAQERAVSASHERGGVRKRGWGDTGIRAN